MINFREGWRGYLWQGRFASFPMDDVWLLRAARYIGLKPVRAKVGRAPWRWKWSSAAAHVEAKDGGLVRTAPLLERAGCGWKEFLAGGLDPDEAERLRRHERTGRPLGGVEFVQRLEKALNRRLRKQKPGPKRRKK
jgi:putative transposase